MCQFLLGLITDVPLPGGQVASRVLRAVHALLDFVHLAQYPLHTTQTVTVPAVTPARKVGLGLQDLQKRARRILAERNAEKAEENTWIGRMVAAENINDMKALIKSRDST